ncbi:hypothetical protein Sp245p_32425 (plasmid) [Azospirillum baldaniorum]|nr:hypothetical protein Sp245p_32425 [Azospirillum baldaniorum]
MRSCPLPDPPPLSQGRGLPPLRDHLPPLRSGGGPGWGQAPRPSRNPCATFSLTPCAFVKQFAERT